MSSYLNVKTRMPFVRQPSNESLAERGDQGSAMAMKVLPSRPASVASTTDGLRPMSLRSLQPLHPAAPEAPAPRGWREVTSQRGRDAAHWAQEALSTLAESPHAVGVGFALTGLTLWCVTLTVYVARSRSDIAALADIPFCEDLGLLPKMQIKSF